MTLLHDLRHAYRVLRKAPAFTAATVAILALAIGANTAMFSIADAWFLRPLHLKDSNQLVIALRGDLKHPKETPIFSFYRDYWDWKQRSHSFQGMSAMFWRDFTITGSGDADHFMGMIVTADIFDTLGTAAQIGRTFAPSDLNGPPVVVISHQLWQERFGGAKDVIGRSVTLNLKPYQVIGVLPSSFSLRMENQEFDARVLALIQTGDRDYTPDSLRPVGVIGRLKPGVDMATAQAELFTIQMALDAQHPEMPKDFGVFLTGLKADNMRFVRTSLVALVAAVALVLLIACANVAGLLLGRAAIRRREMALRAALGSGRGRLIRQLLTESLVLALAGAVLGVLLAGVGVRAFASVNPFHQLPPDPIVINGRALLCALVLALVNTALFGAAPAWLGSRVDLNSLLKSRGAGGRVGPGRGILVAAEIALSLVLLTGAAVLTKTLVHLLTQPLGFRTDGVSAATMTLPGERYATDARRLNGFYDQVLQRASTLPGVESATISSTGPLVGGQRTTLAVQGEPELPPNESPRFEQQVVTPGFFEVLSVPLLRGRTFSTRDSESAPPVAIVNEALVRKEFSGKDPVGRLIRVGASGPWRTIIGVTGTMRTIFYNTLEAKEPLRIFVPAAQTAQAGFNPVSQSVWLMARTDRPLTLPELRKQVAAIDPTVAVGEVRGVDRSLADVTLQPRFRAVLLGGFAVLGLILSAIGIYGLTAQNTAQRTSEIGVRMALGARSGDVLRMVIRQGLSIAAVGIAIGVVGAVALARIMSNLLYGAAGADLATCCGVAGVVLAVAALAAYGPARRASRVDPMVALRDE